MSVAKFFKSQKMSKAVRYVIKSSKNSAEISKDILELLKNQETPKFTSMKKINQDFPFGNAAYVFMPIDQVLLPNKFCVPIDNKLFFKIGSFVKKIPKARLEFLLEEKMDEIIEDAKMEGQEPPVFTKKFKSNLKDEICINEYKNINFEAGFSCLCVIDQKNSEFIVFGSDSNSESAASFLRKQLGSLPVYPYSIGFSKNTESDGDIVIKPSESQNTLPESITNHVLSSILDKNDIFNSFGTGNSAKIENEGAIITHNKQDLTDVAFTNEFVIDNDVPNEASLMEIALYSKDSIEFKFNAHKLKISNIAPSEVYFLNLERRLVDALNLDEVDDLYDTDKTASDSLATNMLDYMYDDVMEGLQKFYDYFQ